MVPSSYSTCEFQLESSSPLCEASAGPPCQTSSSMAILSQRSVSFTATRPSAVFAVPAGLWMVASWSGTDQSRLTKRRWSCSACASFLFLAHPKPLNPKPQNPKPQSTLDPKSIQSGGVGLGYPAAHTYDVFTVPPG